MKIENNLNKLKEKKPDSKFLAFIVIVFLIVFFTARYATDEDFRTLVDVNILKKQVEEFKNGGQIEWVPEIILDVESFKEGGEIEWKPEIVWEPEIQEFKEGGKTKESDIPEIEETIQKNVIPEGALHKNKHHMEHAEGLTKKGIPVIDEDGEQQAEIEHSEIIFTLEVTKKLEEYYEIFYSESASNKEKEQAALEAGKLLVY